VKSTARIKEALKQHRGGRIVVILTIAALALSMTTPAYAAQKVQTQTLPSPSSTAAGNRLGFAVALSGDGNTALVGAPGTNPPTNTAGQAFIYTRCGGSWTLQQQLVPNLSSTAQQNDFFGGAVALNQNGTVAIVAATGTSPASGTAFIFTRLGNHWSQQAKLTGSSTSGDEFGFSVALNGLGNVALVGAPGENSDMGAVYVFTQQANAWVRTKLTDPGNPTPTAGDSFGFSVALSSLGNVALIGADQYGYTPANGNGFAEMYVQRGVAWQASHLFTASNGVLGDAFGNAVALSGDASTVLIGAEGVNNLTGAAYSFTQQANTWSQRQELSGASPGDNFGYLVALDSNGGVAAVSAPLAIGLTGTVYMFAGKPGSWPLTPSFEHSGVSATSNYSSYGIGLALNQCGNVLLVGADGEGAWPNALGTVYAYEFS
jgi:hypothetical protein